MQTFFWHHNRYIKSQAKKNEYVQKCLRKGIESKKVYSQWKNLSFALFSIKTLLRRL